MIRLAVMILTVFALNVVPFSASAHGAGMMAGHHAAATQMDHAPRAKGTTPTACKSQGGCLADSALCAWVCAGMAATAPSAPQANPQALTENAYGFLPAITRAGIDPPLNKRPPKLHLI